MKTKSVLGVPIRNNKLKTGPGFLEMWEVPKELFVCEDIKKLSRVKEANRKKLKPSYGLVRVEKES